MATLNGKKVNNARYYDRSTIDLYKAAGVNPCGATPLRISDSKLKIGTKHILSIADEQAAINSVRWYNLPQGLDANLIERVLYYRGQGMFFYYPLAESFFFLPYTLGSKGIDVYGRYINATPLPFNGAASGENPWITGLEFDVAYDLAVDFDISKCVLLTDYTRSIAQTISPRSFLNEPIIDLESDLLPFARTNLLNGTGVTGMRVGDEDEVSNVNAVAAEINAAAIDGRKYVGIFGAIDFQSLTADGLINVDNYLMAMQAIDNFRLQTHGVDSGGIFQKQAHMLTSENEMNARKSSYTMLDRLNQRQYFCDVVNSLFGLGVWCEAAEEYSGATVYPKEAAETEEVERNEGNEAK